MATLREGVLSLLQADATLMALLTGGLNDWDSLDGHLGLTPENAAYEADGVTLKPQCVVTYSTESPALETYGPTRGRRRFMQLWVYTHDSYSTIDAALRQAEGTLHRSIVETTDAGHALISYVDDGPDFIDDELLGAFARSSRYYLQFSRR